jgi:hypothetical protein
VGKSSAASMPSKKRTSISAREIVARSNNWS